MKQKHNLSLSKYCLPCNSKCCRTGKLIGSPILSKEEISLIKNCSNIKEVTSPTGKKYYIITGMGKTNNCFFLKKENKCEIQNSKPLDCLCYPIKAIYKNNSIKFIVDSNCPAAKHLTKDFIKNAKMIAVKSIMRWDKKTYQHWLDNYVGWVKKGVEL